MLWLINRNKSLKSRPVAEKLHLRFYALIEAQRIAGREGLHEHVVYCFFT